MVNFNITEEERKSADAVSYDNLPAGIYNALLEKVTTKTSQAGFNYVGVTLGVIDGDFKGRKYFENLNLFHPEEKTRQIAIGKLRLFEKALDTVIGSEEEFSKFVGAPLTFELEQSKKGNIYLKMVVKTGLTTTTDKSMLGIAKPKGKKVSKSELEDDVGF